jgi:hypothetical protein
MVLTELSARGHAESSTLYSVEGDMTTQSNLQQGEARTNMGGSNVRLEATELTSLSLSVCP